MSLSERKKQIIIDIASSYSNQIISNNQIKSSVIATSFISVVQSKKDADLCENCMLTYLTQDDIDKAIKDNSNSNVYLELFNQIGKGVCGGLCYVNIEDIEQNNILIYDISSSINTEINIKKIIDYVKSEIQKRYGYTDTSNNFDKSITDIINDIKPKVNVNMTQNISALQSINIGGSGQVKGVTQNLIINAIMNAITSSSDALNSVDQMVQEQMDFIKSEVDKNIIGDFTYVWEESKWYIIGCGIFLLSLFIIIIVLLMYKASK